MDAGPGNSRRRRGVLDDGGESVQPNGPRGGDGGVAGGEGAAGGSAAVGGAG